MPPRRLCHRRQYVALCCTPRCRQRLASRFVLSLCLHVSRTPTRWYPPSMLLKTSSYLPFSTYLDMGCLSCSTGRISVNTKDAPLPIISFGHASHLVAILVADVLIARHALPGLHSDPHRGRLRQDAGRVRARCGGSRQVRGVPPQGQAAQRARGDSLSGPQERGDSGVLSSYRRC